jgi:hypothetical protein
MPNGKGSIECCYCVHWRGEHRVVTEAEAAAASNIVYEASFSSPRATGRRARYPHGLLAASPSAGYGMLENSMRPEYGETRLMLPMRTPDCSQLRSTAVATVGRPLALAEREMLKPCLVAVTC